MSFINSATYVRCGCIAAVQAGGGGGNTPVVADPCGNNCLYSGDVIIPCSDQVGPGQGGVADLDVNNNAAAYCATGYTFSLSSYDQTVFSAVAITDIGGVTFTIDAAAEKGTYGKIKYVISCDGEMFSTQATLSVCVYDNCSGIFCPEGEVCVNGACVPVSDIEVS